MKGHHMRDVLPALPEKPLKQFTDHHDPSFIQDRCIKLERFLIAMTSIPHVGNMVCMKAFLGIMDQVRFFAFIVYLLFIYCFFEMIAAFRIAGDLRYFASCNRCFPQISFANFYFTLSFLRCVSTVWLSKHPPWACRYSPGTARGNLDPLPVWWG